jgi:hypothetical protein
VLRSVYLVSFLGNIYLVFYLIGYGHGFVGLQWRTVILFGEGYRVVINSHQSNILGAVVCHTSERDGICLTILSRGTYFKRLLY